MQQHCGYEGVDELFASGEIDAVYIALPNEMHKDYTIRAARAGLHVLCEKPMAVNASECEEMIRATREANVKLMIAYRLHFERANLEVAKLARTGKLGELRFFTLRLLDAGERRQHPAGSARKAAARCTTSASIASMPRAIVSAKIR